MQNGVFIIPLRGRGEGLKKFLEAWFILHLQKLRKKLDENHRKKAILVYLKNLRGNETIYMFRNLDIS